MWAMWRVNVGGIGGWVWAKLTLRMGGSVFDFFGGVCIFGVVFFLGMCDNVRRFQFGGLPKWPTGADCKSAGSAFLRSNRRPTTIFCPRVSRGFFCCPAGDGLWSGGISVFLKS